MNNNAPGIFLGPTEQSQVLATVQQTELALLLTYYSTLSIHLLMHVTLLKDGSREDAATVTVGAYREFAFSG